MGLPKIMVNIYTFVFHTVRYGFNTMFTLLDFSVNERAPRGLAVLTLGTTTGSDFALRYRLRLNSDVLESF